MSPAVLWSQLTSAPVTHGMGFPGPFAEPDVTYGGEAAHGGTPQDRIEPWPPWSRAAPPQAEEQPPTPTRSSHGCQSNQRLACLVAYAPSLEHNHFPNTTCM